MQCRSCSGNDFKKTSTGNYKCSYCGTLYYEEIQKVNIDTGSRIKISAISGSVIAVVIIILIAFISSGSKNNKKSRAARATNTHTFQNTEKPPEPQGEILTVDSIRDSIGNIYFLVMCRNSGKIAIKKPEVIVRLYSLKDEKVATGKGYAFMDSLNPGEITPVYVLITKYPKYEKIETDFTPELPYIIPEGGINTKKLSAEFMDVSMRQTCSSNSHEIKGKIKNKSEFPAKYVKVAAVLYDKNNKAAGYGYSYISEKILRPGNFDFFKINIYTVTAKPEYYKLFFEANVN